MRLAFVFAAGALLAASGAHANGLVEDFRAALSADPQWLAAIATRDAGIEAREQGLAQLLPQVSFSATQGRGTTESVVTSGGPANPVTRDYSSFNYALQIRQPIYRMRAWATYEQGKVQAAYAEATLVFARQDLALRVITAYAEWANALGELENAEAQVATAEFIQRAAERSLQGGDGTRVDVETAAARLEQTRATRTNIQGQLQSAILNWRQITGNESLRAPPTLAGSLVERLALDPAALPQWQDAALASSSQIRALELAVEATRAETRKARGDHYPTVDLFASRSRSQSDSDFTIGQRFDTTRYGIQLNVPIYAGGQIDSQVRQALANLRRAENELEAGRQKLKLQIERDWYTFTTARASVTAARKAFDSAQFAAYAAQLGLRAGTATRIDEANALAQASTARRDLVQASARALFAWARLHSNADRLDESGLLAADAALAATAIALESTRMPGNSGQALDTSITAPRTR